VKIVKKCFSCKYYRPHDELTGRCRVDKDTLDHRNYPLMEHEDLCERWVNSGQQYFIRVGWLKKLKMKQQESDNT
jgi:hypothetical protein